MGLVKPEKRSEGVYTMSVKRNFLLFLFFLVSILLIVNSIRRLLAFKTTTERVGEAEERLVRLHKENEELKQELEYKKSQEFAEKEIRDKLGLAKPGEAVVVLPKKNDESLDKLGTSSTNDERRNKTPNYTKWWRLFFGS